MPVEAVEGVDGNWTLYEKGGLRATAREFKSKELALAWAVKKGWKIT
jgi:hypothetical protein